MGNAKEPPPPHLERSFVGNLPEEPLPRAGEGWKRGSLPPPPTHHLFFPRTLVLPAKVQRHTLSFLKALLGSCIVYPPRPTQQVPALVKDIVGSLQPFGVRLSGIKKVIRSAIHILEDLGLASFVTYLHQSIVPQLEVSAAKIAAEKAPGTVEVLLPNFHSALDSKMNRVQEQLLQAGIPLVSPKATELLRLLNRLISGQRVIVFVQEVVLVSAFSQLIDASFGKHVAGTITGAGSMTQKVRTAAVAAFATGETPVMVCTSALEEGVRVPACSVVIRFSGFRTAKSHIQGSRHAQDGAEVYYFENDPMVEHGRAQCLQQVARDESLSLSEAQRQKPCTIKPPTSDVHPFRLPGSGTAEINLFNALHIVYEYSSKVMGQCLSQEILCYDAEEVCVLPLPLSPSLSLSLSLSLSRSVCVCVCVSV